MVPHMQAGKIRKRIEVVITALTRKTFSFIPLEFRKPLILLRFGGFRMHFHKTSSRSFLAKLRTLKFHTERYRSGHNGADSKSVCEQSHGGSNPPLSASEPKSARISALIFLNPMPRLSPLHYPSCSRCRYGNKYLPLSPYPSDRANPVSSSSALCWREVRMHSCGEGRGIVSS